MKKKHFIERVREKRGGSTTVEIIVVIVLLTFFMFFPIATFSLNQKQNALEDVLSTGIQMVSIQGGLTDEVEDAMFLNLEAKGLIPEGTASDPDIRSKINLETNADARGGSTSNLIYRDDADPTIELALWYPIENEIKLIRSLTRLIGGEITPDAEGKSWYYRPKGYILSEKVDY
jgi:Flp pilus assembly protein TadG